MGVRKKKGKERESKRQVHHGDTPSIILQRKRERKSEGEREGAGRRRERETGSWEESIEGEGKKRS